MLLIYVNIHYINMKSLKLKTWIEIGDWYGLIFPFQSVGMAESSQKKNVILRCERLVLSGVVGEWDDSS